MSFFFNWLDLELTDMKTMINSALSTLNLESQSTPLDIPMPQNITIKNLEFGSNPPSFEILDVPELNEKKFKGLFKFTYRGELKVVVNAEIEINALNLINFDSFTRPHFVLSDKSTVIPVDFKIYNLKIDALLTVVYNGKEVIVVFNDEPFIDLDLETSIDELLDDELFEGIKSDALKVATELIKDDLPEFIKDAQAFKSLEHDNELINHEIDKLKRTLPPRKDDDDHDDHDDDDDEERSYEIAKPVKIDINDFDTLSLKPTSFPDVYQRNLLPTYEASQPLSNSGSSKKKLVKRKIKMSKLRKVSATSSPAKSKSGSQSLQSSISSMKDFSVDESISSSTPTYETHDRNATIGQIPKMEPPSPSTSNDNTVRKYDVPQFQIQSTPINSSTVNSPLLADYSQISSIESYLDLKHESGSVIDPYEDLLHPRDLDLDAGEYTLESGSSSIDFELPGNGNYKGSFKKRPRKASSNYINLNEFKQFLGDRENGCRENVANEGRRWVSTSGIRGATTTMLKGGR